MATGDLDGDGFTDLRWKNTDGQVVGWRMVNSAFAGAIIYPTYPAGWETIGAVDFDLDGRAEILWWFAPTNRYFI